MGDVTTIEKRGGMSDKQKRRGEKHTKNKERPEHRGERRGGIRKEGKRIILPQRRFIRKENHKEKERRGALGRTMARRKE